MVVAIAVASAATDAAPPHSRSASVAVAATSADTSPQHGAPDAVVSDLASQIAVVVRGTDSLSTTAAHPPRDRGPAWPSPRLLRATGARAHRAQVAHHLRPHPLLGRPRALLVALTKGHAAMVACL